MNKQLDPNATSDDEANGKTKAVPRTGKTASTCFIYLRDRTLMTAIQQSLGDHRIYAVCCLTDTEVTSLYRELRPKIVIIQEYDSELFKELRGEEKNMWYIVLRAEVSELLDSCKRRNEEERLTRVREKIVAAAKKALLQFMEATQGRPKMPLNYFHFIEMEALEENVFEILQEPVNAKPKRAPKDQIILILLENHSFSRKVLRFILDSFEPNSILRNSNDVILITQLYRETQPDIVITEMYFFKYLKEIIGNDFFARVVVLTTRPWEELAASEKATADAQKEILTNGVDLTSDLQKCLATARHIPRERRSVFIYGWIRQSSQRLLNNSKDF